MVASFIDGTAPDIVGDIVGLAIAVCTFAGLIYAAVRRGTAPLRARLDGITEIAEQLKLERARVDDLSEKVSSIESRIPSIERRIEDLYRLLVSLLGPRATPPAPDADAG